LRGLLILFAITVAAQAAEPDNGPLQGRQIMQVIDEFRERGYPFAYSTNLVDESLRVIEEPEATDPLAMVREILEPHGLTVRSEAGVHLVVRTDKAGSDQAGQQSIATGAGDGQPSAKTEIETIAVSASRYEIARDLSTSRFSLDQRDIATMPDIGDDPLRALQRLPGAAASGASAKTHIRGGNRDEIGIVLNGQKLFDPFHVRDYQSVFSAIDSRAIEGVEVYTGGFPVRYGNRMSGMVLMETLEPLKSRHTEIGLSVYNASLLMAGSEADTQWLLSARRGNLDLVIDPKFGSPSFYDVFGELAWQPNADVDISLNALFADDRVELILETDPEELERVVSDTRNAELWLAIDNRWSETLSSKTVLSASWFENLRRGSLGDDEAIVASVFDDRRMSQFGLRQDFSYHPSDRHLLQWGLHLRSGRAEYAYRNSAEYFGLEALIEPGGGPSASAVATSPEGTSYALYVADRWKLSANTSVEWGLRWDDQTYTDTSADTQLSPRFSVLRSLGQRTELRLSWGRYYQAQEINELQVEDGIAQFWPAQRADQLILGFRHAFDERRNRHYALRIELFDKRLSNVQPRFENLYNPLGLIPEVQPDRVRLDPSGGRSRGFEVSLDRRSGPLTWWATYVFAKATDRIDGRNQLRSWDQPHAVQGGVNFSNERWEWGLAAKVHSGWPLTELSLVEVGVDDGGEIQLAAVPGPRNAGRYQTFASLDMRIARKWQLPRGKLSAFLEVSNLTNRRNQCCLDWELEEDETTGEDVFERGIDYWMPLLPAIGILYEF